MGRTGNLEFKLLGVCYDKLDKTNMNYILTKIIEILLSKEFIDMLLPWVSKICQSSPTHMSESDPETERINTGRNLILGINPSILSSLFDCLLLLSNDDLPPRAANLDDAQRMEVNRILEFLKDYVS
jgi:hypothetical protein